MEHSLKYLVVPFVSMFAAQVIKFLIESHKAKKWMWGRLFNGSGGMPSSHTAFSFSLSIALGIGEGFNSSLFSLGLIFALVTAYDSFNVRQESGKHAEILNDIAEEFFSKKGSKKKGINKLKESLGHKPLEVFCGALLGAVVATLIMLVF